MQKVLPHRPGYIFRRSVQRKTWTNPVHEERSVDLTDIVCWSDSRLWFKSVQKVDHTDAKVSYGKELIHCNCHSVAHQVNISHSSCSAEQPLTASNAGDSRKNAGWTNLRKGWTTGLHPFTKWPRQTQVEANWLLKRVNHSTLLTRLVQRLMMILIMLKVSK